MKSLPEILKENGQNPSFANQAGKIVFDEELGCKVYIPPSEKFSQIKKSDEKRYLKAI